MAQRVRKSHRGQGPSSVTQLPILTALHARLPTLFMAIIHQRKKNVNTFFIPLQNSCLTIRPGGEGFTPPGAFAATNAHCR